MPLWNCDIKGCDAPSVRTIGDCVLCNRHLCARHLRPGFHDCPRWEDAETYDPAAQAAEERELAKLISKIDTKALEARASRLRGGVACSTPPLRYDREKRTSFMGGMNYHIELRFEDGVVWIARVRRFNATSPPSALRDYIIRSEVATLKFLEKTQVPAPKVHDFALEGADNPVGVGFILMDKLPGKSLRWSLASEEQRSKVVAQVADVLMELQKYSFDSMGSLIDVGELQVSAFARESLTTFEGSEMHTIGPLSNLQTYHRASLELILQLILNQEMYSGRAVDAYLIHKFLVELVPQVLPPPEEEQKFYLKHADDKGDHILVDDDYQITGIIDWEWTHTAPAALAFNSPIGFLPVGDFYDGKNDIGQDEEFFAQCFEAKGADELAQHVRRGRLQHRFAFCCGYDLVDWDGFQGLFAGLRKAIGVDADLGWEEWKQTALARYEHDDELQALLGREQNDEARSQGAV